MRNEGRTINGVDYEEKLRDGNYKTELTNEINDKLKTVTHTPKDKWSSPQTSNQEIGWYVDVLKNLYREKIMKIHNLFTSDRVALKPTMLIVTTQCDMFLFSAVNHRNDGS